MKTKWLLSTIGKRAYIADYLREADPEVHIVGTGRTGFTPGFLGCDEAVLMPDISDPGYLEAVRQLVRKQGIDAILSFSDPDVAALSTIREDLTALGACCFFPDCQSAQMGFDKRKTADWAIANQVLAPATFLDGREALAALGLPLIRKPRFGSASIGVSVIRHERDLLPPHADTAEYIYQELIAGEEVNVEICGNLHGQPMGVSAWRKVCSRNGETELAVTTRRQGLIDYGMDIGRRAAIVGPCDVDLIDRGGQLFLIEFNMRFGGGYPVSHLAGAGFLELLVRAQRGETLEPRTDFAGDVFMMKTLRPFGGRLAQAEALFLLKDSYRG
jgi:carbamoyl-phosphate synthase large subunit